MFAQVSLKRDRLNMYEKVIRVDPDGLGPLFQRRPAGVWRDASSLEAAGAVGGIEVDVVVDRLYSTRHVLDGTVVGSSAVVPSVYR